MKMHLPLPICGGHKMAVQDRIDAALVAPRRCAVLDCEYLTSISTRNGLNRAYCRRHEEHFRRHGSYSKRSYSASELRPYRKAALIALRAARDSQPVREAVERVGTLFQRAGRSVDAFRRAGLPPVERAWATWASLRVREVEPLEVLAACMAVDMLHAEDPQPERQKEYRQVQMAKLLHRMAGGTHKRWEQAGGSAIELHLHPHSRGMVLRHVGREAWRLATGLRALLPMRPTDDLGDHTPQ